MLASVDRKTGKCGTTSDRFEKYQATTAGVFITTTSSRNCLNGKLDERFIWLRVRGKTVLFKYEASNPLL
jgi:hypothetical protein